jgi:hypothetical protein
MGKEVVKIKLVRPDCLYAHSMGQASGRLGGKGYESLIELSPFRRREQLFVTDRLFRSRQLHSEVLRGFCSLLD